MVSRRNRQRLLTYFLIATVIGVAWLGVSGKWADTKLTVLGTPVAVLTLFLLVFQDVRINVNTSERDLAVLRQGFESEAFNRDMVIGEVDSDSTAVISLQWRLLEPFTAGSISAAADFAGSSALRLPLPVSLRLSASALNAGGPVERTDHSEHSAREGELDLYDLYISAPRGLLVICGEAGAGKSVAARKLARRALNTRGAPDESDRRGTPIPITVSLAGWRYGTPLAGWVATSMASTWRFLETPNGAGEATKLIDDGQVSVVLEGFDEVTPDLQRDILDMISRSRGMRVVLLAQSDAIRSAARFSPSLLANMVIAELAPLSPAEISEQLHRFSDSVYAKLSAEWERLLLSLEGQERASRLLSAVLSTPLYLSLAWSTYGPRGDVSELQDKAAEPSADREEIERVLMNRLIESRYPSKLRSPEKGWTARQARDTLTYLARGLQTHHRDETSRLYWWELVEWIPRWPSILITGLVFAAFGLAFAGVLGMLSGFGVGLIGWVVLRNSTKQPVRIAELGLRPGSTPRLLASGVGLGCIGGSVYGVVYGLKSGIELGFVVGLAGMLLAMIDAALTGRMVAAPADDNMVIDPKVSWRNDWTAGMVRGSACGLVYGLVTGVGYAVVGSAVSPTLSHGLAAVSHHVIFEVWRGGLGTFVYSLLWGILFGSYFGLVYSYTWPARLAFLRMHIRERTPLHLIDFLEDARSRGILRAEGPAYTFFHRSLQDMLAPDESKRAHTDYIEAFRASFSRLSEALSIRRSVTPGQDNLDGNGRPPDTSHGRLLIVDDRALQVLERLTPGAAREITVLEPASACRDYLESDSFWQSESATAMINLDLESRRPPHCPPGSRYNGFSSTAKAETKGFGNAHALMQRTTKRF